MKSIATILYSLCLLIVFSSLKGQIILTYGNTPVSKDEFQRAFLKNNNNQQPTEKSYRDYLELYIRFKLKVKAAYDRRLDTLQSQKAELADFRNQIIEGYLDDDSSYNHLVKEAFVRSQKDIQLGHIYVSLNAAGSTKGDTTIAWKQAMNAYRELSKGSDFRVVALKYSSDPSVVANKGIIGHITVFTLPYAFENLAYNLQPGKFSFPYRSRAGYHIFKNTGERKAVGRIKVAQILFAFPPEASNVVRADIKRKSDSVYNAIMNGASFNQMVLRYSSDNENYKLNGEIPEFGVGKYDVGYENSVFALIPDGNISKPILTAQGYHIVKKLAHYPVNSEYMNDSAITVLKQQVKNDSRIEVAQNIMLSRILRITGFKKTTVNQKDLVTFAGSARNGKTFSGPSGINGNTLMFSFPGKKVYVSELISYLQSAPGAIPPKSVNELINQFVAISATKYYRENLELYNPEFAAQMHEFKEGNLLFEIMQQDVWNKAAADTNGLKTYYEANKPKYWWEPGADAVIFTCEDSSVCNQLRLQLVRNDKNWRSDMLPFESRAVADSGRFEIGQLAIDKDLIKPGTITLPVKAPLEKNNTSFIKIIKVYTERSPRSFEEARGFVVSDYQSHLEEKWINTLKAQYPVKVNEGVLRSLWQ